MADFERIADPNELASRAEEKNLQADLAEQRQRMMMGLHPAWRAYMLANPGAPMYSDHKGAWSYCVDCEDEIEEARAALRFARCLGCQVAHEKARRQRGR